MSFLHWLGHVLWFMWYWPNWIGNISASILVTVLVGLCWPKLRHIFEAWVDAKMHHHLNNHHDAIVEKLTKHVDDHMAKIHEKLDK